jgi:hypothetical protein
MAAGWLPAVMAWLRLHLRLEAAEAPAETLQVATAGMALDPAAVGLVIFLAETWARALLRRGTVRSQPGRWNRWIR